MSVFCSFFHSYCFHFIVCVDLCTSCFCSFFADLCLLSAALPVYREGSWLLQPFSLQDWALWLLLHFLSREAAGSSNIWAGTKIKCVTLNRKTRKVQVSHSTKIKFVCVNLSVLSCLSFWAEVSCYWEKSRWNFLLCFHCSRWTVSLENMLFCFIQVHSALFALCSCLFHLQIFFFFNEVVFANSLVCVLCFSLQRSWSPRRPSSSLKSPRYSSFLPSSNTIWSLKRVNIAGTEHSLIKHSINLNSLVKIIVKLFYLLSYLHFLYSL